MRKLLPALAALALMLTACGPSQVDFRKADLNGETACIHFGPEGADGSSSVTALNREKAAEHASKASTEALRALVEADAKGNPVINDAHAFRLACEEAGHNY
ncbi:hypothetical protein [Paeniglutamicibacter cryotolerans]|uniref:Lipoprotein n=1 Tax=Paeniglutamicibacter cryotolerans TaxID=670079 RepID=A0A839QY30_9MICC|nr:hypothetical protein [Paeniglutamicibacter cryotolerans]MBB2996861.1 hypothetical protein [Paeniglutamicibacter cryotolerans]